MKVSVSETEDERASPLQNEEVYFEEREVVVMLKKYREASGSYHSRNAVYEAVVEVVHPEVRACVSALMGHALAESPWSEPQMVVRLFHGWNLWRPVIQC